MYLYQPCLLTMTLYAWAFDTDKGKGHWLRLLFPLVVLAVSEWELTYTCLWLYPAALLLPVLFLWRKPKMVAWAEVLTAALFGGLLCWKIGDLWPLLPALMLLSVALMLAPIYLLCRSREDRLLAFAFGGLVYELFFCLREYMLFSFCVIRLGSREALSLGTAAVCASLLLEQVRLYLPVRRNHTVSIGN